MKKGICSTFNPNGKAVLRFMETFQRWLTGVSSTIVPYFQLSGSFFLWRPSSYTATKKLRFRISNHYPGSSLLPPPPHNISAKRYSEEERPFVVWRHCAVPKSKSNKLMMKRSAKVTYSYSAKFNYNENRPKRSHTSLQDNSENRKISCDSSANITYAEEEKEQKDVCKPVWWKNCNLLRRRVRRFEWNNFQYVFQINTVLELGSSQPY